jgi:peptidase M28-like protein
MQGISARLMRARRIALLGIALFLATPARGDSSFDAKRAFADLTDLVQMGPRVAGTPAAARAHDLIRDRLKQAGWLPTEADEPVTLADGRNVDAANIWSSKKRPGKPRLFLVTHYDTKDISPGADPGANDGASGVALLLELARQLPDGVPTHELHLVFFDRSESLADHVDVRDGLYGSRALVRRFESEGLLEKLAGVIFVDQVADRDLSLTPGEPRSKTLLGALQKAAELEGSGLPVDVEMNYRIPGDHQAFLERGVTDILPIVDFRFGRGSPPGDSWHSSHDDLSAVTEESLGRSGRVVVELVRILGR